MAGSVIAFELDEKQLAAFRKRVERWRGAPLRARISKGTLKAADYMVKPIRALTPVLRAGRRTTQATMRTKPGDLRRSVRARPAKTSLSGGITGAFVGPSAPHGHLVIKGTDPHPLKTVRSGRSLYQVLPDGGVRHGTALHHPGARPNPFVDKAAQAHSADAFKIVSAILFGPG